MHPTFYPGTCTIETLLEELEDISGSEWFNLGIKLGVKDSTLRDIEANHRDVQRCKREMLRAWLQSGPTNPWTKLATTLECMGRKVLAQKILENYTTPHYPSKTVKVTLALLCAALRSYGLILGNNLWPIQLTYTSVVMQPYNLEQPIITLSSEAFVSNTTLLPTLSNSLITFW